MLQSAAMADIHDELTDRARKLFGAEHAVKLSAEIDTTASELKALHDYPLKIDDEL